MYKLNYTNPLISLHTFPFPQQKEMTINNLLVNGNVKCMIFKTVLLTKYSYCNNNAIMTVICSIDYTVS